MNSCGRSSPKSGNRPTSIRPKLERAVLIVAAAIAAAVPFYGCAPQLILANSLVSATPLLASLLASREETDLERGRISEFEQKQDWAELADFAQDKLRREPGKSEGWLWSGYASLRRGDFPRAIAAFSRATQLSPEDGVAWSMLGETQRLSGKPEPAARTLEHAATVWPASFVVFFLLGEAYRDGSRTERAAAAYRRSLEIEPGYAPAWFRLGTIAVQNGRREEARAIGARLEQLDPGLAAALSRMQTGSGR